MHPVAIVGGGPVGLSSSIFLSLCNVPHVLFERYPGTSIHPKALALNQRSMEFLRLLGIEEEIAQQRAAADTYSRTAWYTSLGPAGREIFARDSGGGGAYAGGYAEASPSQFTIFPQIRLEPILHRRAVELNPSGIFNSATATRIEEGTDSVQITVEHKLTGAIEEVEAAYLLGCDGGRTVAEAAGIAMEGERDIVDMVSAHIQSPISQHQPDPRVFLHWFINPELGGSIGTGYLYHCGPYPMNPETEEWIFACALNPGDPKKFEADDMLRRVRNTLQIPDLDIKLKSLSHWFVNSIVAERFRSAAGRVFLLGDAAHRVTPWGALGLNTGLQDAQNLLWKLVAAIKGDFKLDWNALLNSYNEKRRPIALRVARTSLANLQAHSAVMDRALGILPENSPAVNVASLKAYLDPDDPNHEERKRAVEKAQEILDTEFHAPGAEIGWFYPELDIQNEGGATNHDGQLLKDGTLDLCQYHPSTIPGHHLPHAWIEKDGRRASTQDLLLREQCVLISQDADTWREFDSDLVKIEIIGDYGWDDVDGKWGQRCGVERSGAVIVRPDGIVMSRLKNSAAAAVADGTALRHKIAKLLQ